MSGRSFEEIADFTNARFYCPPNFDGVNNAARIDFTGAHIRFVRPMSKVERREPYEPRGKLKLVHWTADSHIPIRLRALRKLAKETKNHDLERNLYIEERKAERGVYWHQQRQALKIAPIMEKPLFFARLMGHGLWIAVMGIYWLLANYGRSVVWPAVWLVSSVFFFYWCYGKILAPLMPKAGTFDADKYEQAVRMLALGNAVPFVGPLTIDAKIKDFLFCPGSTANCLPIPPEGYQWLVLGQNLLSIILVFFIGLALRNYFKIK